MSAITLKNIPPTIHARLKKRAHQHRRSLQNEILFSLQRSLDTTKKVDPLEELQKIRLLRNRLSVRLTDRHLTLFKQTGRP